MQSKRDFRALIRRPYAKTKQLGEAKRVGKFVQNRLASQQDSEAALRISSQVHIDSRLFPSQLLTDINPVRSEVQSFHSSPVDVCKKIAGGTVARFVSSLLQPSSRLMAPPSSMCTTKASSLTNKHSLNIQFEHWLGVYRFSDRSI